MENRNWLFMLVILNTLLFVMPGGCYRIPTLPDNCTCRVTSNETYSLFRLRRTDGKPKFTETGFQPHPAYSYSYNPCVPYTLVSKKGICENVALCKYNAEDVQPVYNDIGEQREVKCDISDGKIALIYPIQHKPYQGQESRVNLECTNDPEAEPKFTLIDEDKLIFQLTSHCGCPNQCLPPTPTTPTTPTTPPRPGPYSSTTPSSGPETTSETTSSRPETTASPSPTDLYSNWELQILLPSLLGALVVVTVFVCLWMRLTVIQRAHLCRCCHCYEQNTDPPRQERIVPITETSALISNHENDRAVEHGYPGVNGKLNEPVQEEEGDGEYKLPGKDYRTVVT